MNSINTLGDVTRIMRMATSNSPQCVRHITGHHAFCELMYTYNTHLKTIAQYVKEYEHYLEQLPKRDKEAEQTLYTVHLHAKSANALINYMYAMLRDVPVSKYATAAENKTSENVIKALRYQLIQHGIDPVA